MRSDLKKLDSLTLETSKNHLIRNFLRNGRLRVNGISSKNFRKLRSSTPTQKGFWIVIFMGGLAGAVYFISQTIDVYLSYPTTTTTRLHLVDQHDFPSNRGYIINYYE